MKIVLPDAQTVVDSLVSADCLKEFGEVTEYGLLKYEEVAEAIADADIVVCNKTLMDAHSMRFADKLKCTFENVCHSGFLPELIIMDIILDTVLLPRCDRMRDGTDSMYTAGSVSCNCFESRIYIFYYIINMLCANR